jgi:hypothetical protein
MMDYRMECMHLAIRNGNLGAIKILQNLYDLDMNDTSSYDEYYGTCLHVAVRYQQNRIDIIEEIIKYGADINATDYYGSSPLVIAIYDYNSSVDIVECLLKHGADLYKFEHGYSPLKLAYKNNKDIYDIMIPYTKGHKKWKRLRIIFRAAGLLLKQYHCSVNNVWKPNGVGYFIAKDEFESLLCNY